MNKFGVCYCDLNEFNIYSSDIKVRDLVIFDTIEEAYDLYLKKVNANNNPLDIPNDLWIVWIDTEGNRIVQLDKLSWHTRTKSIDLKDVI